MYLLHQNNSFGWAEWFRLPYETGMTGSCIGSRNTYYKCIKDLQAWKLIDYKKGVNYHKAPLFKIYLLKSEQVEGVYLLKSEHNNITNNNSNITNNKKENFDFVKNDFWDLWKEWISYRKKIRKHFKTKNGMEKSYNKLIKLSAGDPKIARRIVEQSIDNEWIGLFELKNENKTGRIPEKHRDYSQDKQF